MLVCIAALGNGSTIGGPCHGSYKGGTSGTRILSSTGVRDWAARRPDSNTGISRKNGSPAPNPIGNPTVIYGTPSSVFRRTAGVTAFTWTGGTPGRPEIAKPRF